MNALTAALKEELNVEMISIGGLQIPESVVVSWGIMAFLVIGSILLTRNLRVDHITKRQAILETVVTFINASWACWVKKASGMCPTSSR